MGLESYYKDHWVEIEEDRLDRYEQMFQWSPAFERLLAPADIKPSQIVGDLGCGPGFLSCELLRKVAPNGRVHSFDVNKDFIERTHAKAKAEGLGDRLELHHLTSETLPIADASLDRIIAKNVMVYVDDPAHTFKEFRRVLKPGGKAHAIDSDFAMVAIDPVPHPTGGRFSMQPHMPSERQTSAENYTALPKPPDFQASMCKLWPHPTQKGDC